MGLFDGTSLERPILCDRCGKDAKVCNCPPPDTPASSQSLRIRVEKRKRGKLVTVVSGFDCSAAQLNETLSALKTHCGAGGTVDSQNIELQGDHISRISEILASRGYRIKRENR